MGGPNSLSDRNPAKMHVFTNSCSEPFFLSVDSYFLAEPPLSPSFHPQSLLSDGRSLQGGCPRFSRCCYLIIDLGSCLLDGSWARS